MRKRVFGWGRSTDGRFLAYVRSDGSSRRYAVTPSSSARHAAAVRRMVLLRLLADHPDSVTIRAALEAENPRK